MIGKRTVKEKVAEIAAKIARKKKIETVEIRGRAEIAEIAEITEIAEIAEIKKVEGRVRT